MTISIRLKQLDFNILDTFIRCDSELQIYEIEEFSGYSRHTLWNGQSGIVMLHRYGLIRRVYHGRYAITERGRIAHALYTTFAAKRTQRRAAREVLTRMASMVAA